MNDPTKPVHSLRSIADEVNREKRTVQAWYTRAKDEHGELGTLVSGTRLFTDAERDILIGYAGNDNNCCRSDTNDNPGCQSVTVDPGNHEIVLSTPQLPSQFSLESLRTSEVTTYVDPLAVANQALAIADQIQTAMQSDLEQRQQRLQDTKRANQELQKRIQAMRLKQLSYELQSQTLDALTTEHTTSLGDSIAELTQLGKPEPTLPLGA